MQEDVERLKKEKNPPSGPEKKTVDKRSVVSKKPGIPLPPEPIETSKLPKLVKPVKTPKPSQLPKPEKTSISETKTKIIPIIIIIGIILIAGGGVYYWKNYLQGIQPREFLEKNGFEITEPLEINVPSRVSIALEKDYTFFIYSQEEGDRAGFLVKVKDSRILKTALRDWEKTMREDLKAIFLGQELTQPSTTEFQDNFYKGLNIRYLNFLNSSLTIDYTIIKDYLIVTTSQESIYRVIDRIL